VTAPSTRREISEAHVANLSGYDMSGYWWYEVRQAHVEAALEPVRARGEMRYLDLGCGTGGVMAAMIARFRPYLALGLDGTQAAVDVACSRGLSARYADFRLPLQIPFLPNAISCLDVLEHLEDPVLALRNLADASTRDAVLVVSVPAMPALHSRWDDLCGHHRRYTRALLQQHLGAGGWECRRARHAFSYCVPPAWLQRRVLRRVQEVEFPAVSPLTNRMLTWAGRVERSLGSPLPFGTSLVAIATRA
jgi:SAM-dependent methyltransferase